MSQLNLTDEEKEVLIEALESRISDLGLEAADTDRKEFRDNLKNKKQVLMKLLEELKK